MKLIVVVKELTPQTRQLVCVKMMEGKEEVEVPIGDLLDVVRVRLGG